MALNRNPLPPLVRLVNTCDIIPPKDNEKQSNVLLHRDFEVKEKMRQVMSKKK